LVKWGKLFFGTFRKRKKEDQGKSKGQSAESDDLIFAKRGGKGKRGTGGKMTFGNHSRKEKGRCLCSAWWEKKATKSRGGEKSNYFYMVRGKGG